MGKTKAINPYVQVNGYILVSVIEGMGALKPRAYEILEDYGISNPETDRWYPQKIWLDTLRCMGTVFGPHVVYQIGLRMPEYLTFPPATDTLEKALSVLDQVYQRDHNGDKVGNYVFKDYGNEFATIVCSSPYPCEWDRGLIEGTVKKFKTNGLFAFVRHDLVQECRKKGDDSCTYLLSWYNPSEPRSD
ncbi:MAG: hypothetical protein ACM3SY_06905 [Candidatus Omnitrophota bacterium]